MSTALLELGCVDAAQFGALLLQLRESRGLTQAELAAKAGLHQRAISKMEQGINLPTMGTAFKLADALEVDVNDFRKAEDFPTDPPAKRGRGRPRKPVNPDD